MLENDGKILRFAAVMVSAMYSYACSIVYCGYVIFHIFHAIILRIHVEVRTKIESLSSAIGCLMI